MFTWRGKGKWAMLSTYDKTGLEEAARRLEQLGYGILASGGTAKALRKAEIEVQDIEPIVGPYILGDRVKTLSRQLSGGLISRPTKEDLDDLQKMDVPWIDFLYVTLYPMAKVIAEGGTPEEVIENTDVGGPTMLRCAAKGGRIVVSKREDLDPVLYWMENGEPGREMWIRHLRSTVFQTCAAYDLEAARYWSNGKTDGFVLEQVSELYYGENPDQTPAGLFVEVGRERDPLGITSFKQLEGAVPSFVLTTDHSRALQTVAGVMAAFEKNGYPGALFAGAFKHGNPCGAGVAFSYENGSGAYSKAIQGMVDGDPRAIFGGTVLTNFSLDADDATLILQHGLPAGSSLKNRPIDAVFAPSFHESAAEVFQRKLGKGRVSENPFLEELGNEQVMPKRPLFRQVCDAWLRQPAYSFVLDLEDPRITKYLNAPVLYNPCDVLLAWGLCWYANSNTIMVVKDLMQLGGGFGQQDRVGAAVLAVERSHDLAATGKLLNELTNGFDLEEISKSVSDRAVPKDVIEAHITEVTRSYQFAQVERLVNLLKEWRSTRRDLNGATAASDSFFPFNDGVEELINAGVRTIVTTSGSKNDEKVIQLCAERKVNLIMIPNAIGRGFCAHG